MEVLSFNVFGFSPVAYVCRDSECCAEHCSLFLHRSILFSICFLEMSICIHFCGGPVRALLVVSQIFDLLFSDFVCIPWIYRCLFVAFFLWKPMAMSFARNNVFIVLHA